jgi:hypothetical protein
MFNHPQLVPRYYAKVLECMNNWFNSATVDPIIDQIMAGWVTATDATATPPNNSIAEIKAYVTARRTNVLNQIQQNYTLKRDDRCDGCRRLQAHDERGSNDQRNVQRRKDL